MVLIVGLLLVMGRTGGGYPRFPGTLSVQSVSLLPLVTYIFFKGVREYLRERES